MMLARGSYFSLSEFDPLAALLSVTGNPDGNPYGAPPTPSPLWEELTPSGANASAGLVLLMSLRRETGASLCLEPTLDRLVFPPVKFTVFRSMSAVGVSPLRHAFPIDQIKQINVKNKL